MQFFRSIPGPEENGDALLSSNHRNTMSLATLTSTELSQVQKLIERKEALTQQIADINSELETIESGTPEPVRVATPARRAATARKSAAATPPAMPLKKRRSGRTIRAKLKERI